ncbi:MAG: rRNA pseudouridine synthase, partial [Oscillospiraceae bacterium]
EFEKGMVIDGGEKCLPAEFSEGDKSNECFVTLHEGKYHQVKRMFHALGNEVVYLRRIAIGKLPLDDNLALGECLEILHKDVEKLLAR